MSKIWYLEAESCFECCGSDEQVLLEDPETTRALEVEVPAGLLRDFENAKRTLARYIEEMAPYIAAAAEAAREESRKKWDQYRKEHPEYPTGLAGLVQRAYDQMVDFQMKSLPLRKDI